VIRINIKNNKGIMKRLYSTIFLVLVLGISQAQNLLIDKVVARVGAESILLSEIEDEFSYIKASKKDVSPDVKCDIIKNMIVQKMIIWQAKLDSIEVKDEDVEAQLGYRFDNILQKMNGDEKFFEEYYGATVNEMKERFRDDQRQKMLADRMQSKLIDKVNISPAEVQTFFNSIPTDSLPYLSSEVEISEIIVKPIVNEIEKQKALDKIKDIQKRLESGEDFGELAKKYSMDTESGKKGGDLGFAKRGSYVPEFESAAFTLEPGKRSDIVETDFGFHILELIERKGNSVHAKHILISPEVTDADREKAKNKLDSLRTLIKNDSITFEDVVKEHSDKDAPSYSNNGKMKNQNNGTNYFEVKDLDYETYFAIDALKPNELSKVLEVKNFKGEKNFRLLKVYSKSEPHQASLKKDYDKIVIYAKEGKKAEFFDKWVNEKLASTNIKVDLIYADCPEITKWIIE
jgi:peptidyl-prolyl cis-trans isomerase SurA